MDLLIVWLSNDGLSMWLEWEKQEAWKDYGSQNSWKSDIYKSDEKIKGCINAVLRDIGF
jgi:hypothetical protein